MIRCKYLLVLSHLFDSIHLYQGYACLHTKRELSQKISGNLWEPTGIPNDDRTEQKSPIGEDRVEKLALTKPEQPQYVKCPISKFIWSVWIIENWRGVFWQTLINERVAKNEFAAVAEAAKYAEDATAVSDTASVQLVALREGIESIFNTTESSLEDLLLLVGDWEVKCTELEGKLSDLWTEAESQKGETQNEVEQNATDLGPSSAFLTYTIW